MLTAEQLKAINHNQGNVIVSASAGSGKTFVMTNRAVRLIKEKKASVKELLMVTFTESSAEEMKQRLKLQLEQLIKDGDKSLILELLDLSTADVCTLHAFCAKTIRRYFFQVNLSPDFQILDANLASALKSEALDATLKTLYNQNEEWFVELIDGFKYKRKDEQFKTVINTLYEYVNLSVKKDEYLKEVLSLYTKDGFNKILSDYKEIVDQKLSNIIENLDFLNEKFKQLFAEKLADLCAEALEVAKYLKSSESVYAVKAIKEKLPK